jgi:hypothetical protein
MALKVKDFVWEKVKTLRLQFLYNRLNTHRCTFIPQ